MRDNRITKMGVGRLCKLFGKSRQSYYQRNITMEERRQSEGIALEIVAGIRRELPGTGIQKLHLLMREPLKAHGIKMGRDKLNILLRNNGLLIKNRRRIAKTTNSSHWFKKYPNLIKEFQVIRSEQLWVSDITYLCVGRDFNYLSLITDAYSHKIVGYYLHTLLTNDGPLKALDMALQSRTKIDKELIHHSDRGVQYCSFDYVRSLREHSIGISMTENGDPYENAIAERINGILKTEFGLSDLFKTHYDALAAVNKAVNAYNALRPHMSCDYMTPNEAHLTDLKLIKRWKPRKKKSTDENTNNVQFDE
ncbi:MAG: IS3 family transposase [Bacteroidetes bacterium]|nr:IS3 family transposase [Bacteroidota bacterium]